MNLAKSMINHPHYLLLIDFRFLVDDWQAYLEPTVTNCSPITIALNVSQGSNNTHLFHNTSQFTITCPKKQWILGGPAFF